MPGSLLNFQDLHSNLSDVSAKSVESRTSGKKVSFNKAVRVKQYPWQPDDYGERNGTLPHQRFWFKVYKSNTNQDSQNSWKDRNFPKGENNEDALDSLMPIAEDDDASSEAIHIDQRQPSLFDGSLIFPPDPPVDYVDDEIPIVHKESDKIANGMATRAALSKTFDKGSVNTTVKKDNANGIVPGTKIQDFKRPTISSTAKCINESRAKSPVIKQAASNVRLPRTPVREYKSDRTSKEHPKITNVREKRSRSIDNNNERGKREISRADKAVSTDDLSSDCKENQENINGDKLWWRKKSSRDKSTQHNGTFTRSRFNTFLDCAETPSARTALLSASNQLNWNKREDPAQKEYSFTAMERPKSGKKENYSNQNSSRAIESNTLALRGRNCISNSMNNLASSNTSTLNKWQMCNNQLKTSQPDTFEYDYVTKDMTPSLKGRDVYTRAARTNVNIDDETHKHFPWRTILNRDSSFGIRKNHNVLPERTEDIHSLSDVEYTRKTQITGDDIDVPTISIPKVKNSLNDDFNSSYCRSDRETSRSRKQFQFQDANRGRSASSDRRIGRGDNDQSMIDWSLSGFQLGSREDSKMSSSSDSECVIHRRPPLLMYIPGVSHHNLPAIEDDRLSALSGISRSEAEDDISPLMYEFKRRHSMPRNGKLNWWKWKAGKKYSQQT